jgi:hypothetical protein
MMPDLIDHIAQAIGDPGSIVGFKRVDENVPRWSTRAVIRVLAMHEYAHSAELRAEVQRLVEGLQWGIIYFSKTMSL